MNIKLDPNIGPNWKPQGYQTATYNKITLSASHRIRKERGCPYTQNVADLIANHYGCTRTHNDTDLWSHLAFDANRIINHSNIRKQRRRIANRTDFTPITEESLQTLLAKKVTAWVSYTLTPNSNISKTQGTVIKVKDQFGIRPPGKRTRYIPLERYTGHIKQIQKFAS